MLSDLTATVSVGGKLEMMRVRATDPRPCPRCGKIYRSAHTLRTHMEDKHTVCTGYRCVLCGTVAKSRNSLHSHMSRQHRGISTKVRISCSYSVSSFNEFFLFRTCLCSPCRLPLTLNLPQSC